MNADAAEVFPVGEFLAEELDERGWTQSEFAEILGRPSQFVSEIVSGKKEITRESATQIAAAFGTSPQYWLNLQDAYLLWKQAQDTQTKDRLDDVRTRARIKDLAPVSILKQRNIIRGESTTDQARELERLYGLDDIFSDPEIMVAARRSKADDRVSGTQLAWIACVRQRAVERNAKEYDRDALQKLARNLTREIRAPGDFARLPTLFAEVGVHLVYVEAFPGSKMDGCAFLLEGGSPVIGISGRGKRFDKVLFTVLHEVAHITLGHLDEQEFVIDDPGESPTLGDEGSADAQAAEWVLPHELPSLPERINQPWITSTANRMGVHPIILIGRLQKDGTVPWKSTLVKGAPSVTDQLKKW